MERRRLGLGRLDWGAPIRDRDDCSIEHSAFSTRPFNLGHDEEIIVLVMEVTDLADYRDFAFSTWPSAK
jgi:hypothetical protein